MDDFLNKIIHGDCRDILPEIKKDHFIAIVTDPPYGINYKSHHRNNKYGPFARYRHGENFKPIIGDNKPFNPSHLLNFDRLILWGANYYCDKLPISNCWLVWDKQEGKTPAKMQADCELAWTNLTGPSRLFHHLWRGIMRKGRENISHGPKLHPHQKPVNLMKWCIKILNLTEEAIVVDPYCGCGSTLVAAYEMGFSYIGIDIDSYWIQIASHRMQEEKRQERLIL